MAQQSASDLELAQAQRELSEAREQQAATAEVLRVISSSPSDPKPVFDTMLANATRICEAKFGILWLCEGDGLRSVALHGLPPAYARERAQNPIIHPSPDIGPGRVAQTKQVFHVSDLKAEPSYGDPVRVAGLDLGGTRTLLIVPMLKENDLIGAIAIYRQEVRPFNDKQIDLVKNFAAQAVIAIENTRLLNELRESLQQQTATADVLSIISSSPGELPPVFQAVLENATRICEARFGIMLMYQDGMFREVAQYNMPSEYANVRPLNSTVFRAPPGGTLAQIVEAKQVVHEEDLATRLSTAKQDERARRLVELIELGGARSILAVPR